MEKNQLLRQRGRGGGGFFSTLKSEVVRGLSPSRSRPSRPASSSSSGRSRSASPMSLFRRRRPTTHVPAPDMLSVPRSVSGLVDASLALSPLNEGPDQDGYVAGEEGGGDLRRLGRRQVSCSSSCGEVSGKNSDPRLLLGVLGAPLAPVHVSSLAGIVHLSIKNTPIESSSAQYILQQYTAASGGYKLQSSIHNAYAMGKVRMVASEFETANKLVRNKNASKSAESGSFVLWQMSPDMWYVELALGGSKVHAGCNGKVVWRHTPWLRAHAAKGPVRPLRRALQGLDPRTTASMFSNAKCIGEKNINGEDCFILKLCADPETLKARSEGPAEIIRHVLFGYFSQKTGLLVHLEDSHLTRIQNTGGDAVYWETTINSFLEDYRPVEGIVIAHSGRSVVTLFRFGETAMSHSKTRMEEAWTIEEVAFNVPGLSIDCFIPPAEIRLSSITEACEFQHGQRVRNVGPTGHRAKVASFDRSHGGGMI
ncbi:hypothetical protein MLD38_002051 [Melastoma candidum]|uniref:Uncharacterized protein n=1 Tax=Melastoma candidum TaxID=119954 RepID=A0ACB9SF45_9MYRT|nr:hypothetical protein MLD38_002051 [Melastoma candidum]